MVEKECESGQNACLKEIDYASGMIKLSCTATDTFGCHDEYYALIYTCSEDHCNKALMCQDNKLCNINQQCQMKLKNDGGMKMCVEKSTLKDIPKCIEDNGDQICTCSEDFCDDVLFCIQGSGDEKYEKFCPSDLKACSKTVHLDEKVKYGCNSWPSLEPGEKDGSKTFRCLGEFCNTRLICYQGNGEEKQADFCPFGSKICTKSVYKDGKMNYGCASLTLLESGQETEDRSIFYKCTKNLCNE